MPEKNEDFLPEAAQLKPRVGCFEHRMCKEEQKKDWSDMKLGSFGNWLAYLACSKI